MNDHGCIIFTKKVLSSVFFGALFFKADGDFRTILYIKNETNEPKKFKASMSWDGGGYSLGVKVIKRNQTLAIDFRELRDNQTPDVSGNVIPLNLELGQIAWSSATPGEKALSGRSEQISEEYGLASTYDCRNQCDDVFDDGWIDPVGWLSSVGEISNFGAWQQDVNSYGQVLPPYPAGGVSWSSNATAVSEIDQQGLATAMSPGTATIEASWQAFRQVGEVGSPECVYEPIIVIRESSGGVVQPTVASISATTLSTKNARTNVRPPAGIFTTQNLSTAFASGSSPADTLVVFKSSEVTLTVTANGVSPSSVATLLRWRIDRDPTDGVTGQPTLSVQTGIQLNISPSFSGNFRLICYFDSNENGSFDSGEELRVLRLVVVETAVDLTTCRFVGTPAPSFDTDKRQNFVRAANAMRVTCAVLLKSGGQNRIVGLDHVRLGVIGNLTADNFTVHHPIEDPPPPPPGNQVGTQFEAPNGRGVTDPGQYFPLPMVDTSRAGAIGSGPTGGDTPFRFSSQESSVSSPPTGGRLVTVEAIDVPVWEWDQYNQRTGNGWATTSGTVAWREYIVGFTNSFTRTYVAVAQGDWRVVLNGTSDFFEWTPDVGATIGVVNPISSLISLNAPKDADLAGIQVLGPSFAHQNEMKTTP